MLTCAVCDAQGTRCPANKSSDGRAACDSTRSKTRGQLSEAVDACVSRVDGILACGGCGAAAAAAGSQSTNPKPLCLSCLDLWSARLRTFRPAAALPMATMALAHAQGDGSGRPVEPSLGLLGEQLCARCLHSEGCAEWLQCKLCEFW